MLSRQQIRQQILTQREKLDIEFREKTAQIICDKIINLEIFQQSNSIAFYLPNKSELDPTALMHQALELNKSCFLPCLNPNQQNSLVFIKYNIGDKLILNRYNILEPIITIAKIIAPENLDLVIVPLVAFDDDNNRLGMGAGYYDRTFAFKRHAKINSKPYLLGIAYEFQKVASIEPNKFDVKMDEIINISIEI